MGPMENMIRLVPKHNHHGGVGEACDIMQGDREGVVCVNGAGWELRFRC